MKFAEDSAQRLVLKDQTFWLSVIFGVVVLWVLYAEVVQHAPCGLLLSGAFFALFALLCLRSSRIEFDKATRVACVTKLQVLRRTRNEFRFDDIQDVAIEAEPLPGHRNPPCRLCLVTPKGSLPLTDAYAGSYSLHEALRLTILKALGRPVSDPFDESLRQLVKSGRTIDAVALLRLHRKMDLTAARLKVAELEKQLNAGG
ncbi:MAG TPA: hypothetical protein VGS99_04345 [Gammaproteobacteria bacterium]|nr:hypothetical protein [Gammaproteobacteria bacterium]